MPKQRRVEELKSAHRTITQKAATSTHVLELELSHVASFTLEAEGGFVSIGVAAFLYHTALLTSAVFSVNTQLIYFMPSKHMKSFGSESCPDILHIRNQFVMLSRFQP